MKIRSKKMGCKKNTHSDLISFQIHNVRLIDENHLPEIEKTIKTFNSAKRCAFKRFNSMNLDWLLKSGRSMGNAETLWQVDRNVGSPIQGTELAIKDWLFKNNHFLDTTLLHDAVMDGFKTFRSFNNKRSRWQTSKSSPSFGELELRSKKKITKEEFQLTRNASITVIGKKAKGGNPKFKFNLEDNNTFTFTLNRKRIGFNFNSNRFSKKGIETLNSIVNAMSEDKLPVTITLTRLEKKGRFNLTLTYSGGELKKDRSRKQSNIVSGIWVSDEVIHHQIIDKTSNNKVIHSRTWKVEDFSGEKRTRKYLDERIAKKDLGKVKKIREKIANRTISEARNILKKIFTTSKGYGASTMVVESARHKTERDFNNSFISFSKNKIETSSSNPCFMTYSRLVKMIQTQCSKFNMKLEKVDGTFIQLKAILESHSMMDAIKNACTTMIGRIDKQSKNRFLGLTDLRKQLADPSMLDWVSHLLHNKRTRQARGEIRMAFKRRAVEKAARLVDNRHRLFDIDINDI